MGVNCLIYLPPDVTDTRLADAVAVLSDAKVEIEATPYVGMGELHLESKTPLVDGEFRHRATFFLAHQREGNVWTHVYPKSTAFWCAMGKRLVDWFGGFLIYADCEKEGGGNVYRAFRRCPWVRTTSSRTTGKNGTNTSRA